MTSPVSRTAFLERFSCLGAECEDTCCKGWSMQVDDPTFLRYQQEAPELASKAVDESGETGRIMRRDPATDYCVKFEGGLCGIHKTRGTDFLSDACHFYPRVTRRLGEKVLMTAAFSCPEVARLALKDDAPFAWSGGEVARLPHTLKDYLPVALSVEKALAVHSIFLDAAEEESVIPERFMMRLFGVSRSLSRIDVATWPEAVPFYLKSADARLSAAEPEPSDPFQLLQALLALQAAARKTPGERLSKTLDDIIAALKVKMADATLLVTLTPESLPIFESMQQRWHAEWSSHLSRPLKRWIQGQLSLMLFPFAGFGNTLEERATLLALRFSIVRLALMSAVAVRGEMISENEIVRIMQSLSRFLDHLADPTLSLAICRDFGWTREGRMRALVGDSLEFQKLRAS